MEENIEQLGIDGTTKSIMKRFDFPEEFSEVKVILNESLGISNVVTVATKN